MPDRPKPFYPITLIGAATITAIAYLASGAEPASVPTAAAIATPWYLGADISGLAGGGRRGGRSGAYQENGTPGTEISIMKAHGWNAFRLRVFVSPVRGAPNNSLENTIALAKQIKAAHAVFLLDIHYSDTWADPQHQEIPVAWRNLDMAGLEKQVEEYSKDVITQLKAADCMPDMVQVGNETTGGLLWPLGHLHVPDSPVKQEANEKIQNVYLQPYDETQVWSNVTRFLKAGVRGVKAGAGDTPPKIVLHIDCGGDWQVTKWWFDHVTSAGVDFDIIGQSFYPRYHGTLSMLQENIVECRKRFGKEFIVAETGYPQTGGEQIMSPPEAMAHPVLSAADPKAKGFYEWPGTQQGQLQYMVDLVNTVKRAGGAGVFDWAPEGSGGNGMWNRDGSPAPAIMVLDHLRELTTQPASKLPQSPTP
jgi:arabinogalactan endo-1,4-beta-galactosidase